MMTHSGGVQRANLVESLLPDYALLKRLSHFRADNSKLKRAFSRRRLSGDAENSLQPGIPCRFP